jgi:hypothetical protein
MRVAQSTPDDRIRVVYIMGAGRSGSTVLDVILGSHPEVFGTGELIHIFREEALHRANCACGEARDACPLWTQVRARWCELTGQSAITDHRELHRRFCNIQSFDLGLRSWMRLRRRPTRQSPSLTECLNQTVALYRAIAETSGQRVIVESSKNPLRARLLCLIPELDVRLVHLVRDARGVAWSRMKALHQSRESGIPREIPSKPVTVSATYWALMNGYSEQVCRLFPDRPSVRIHYEDFVAFPTDTLNALGELASLDFSQVAMQLAAGEPMNPGHLYAGNRVRTAGPIHLKQDCEWAHNLTPRQQRIIWALTARQMNRYGYPRSLDFESVKQDEQVAA